MKTILLWWQDWRLQDIYAKNWLHFWHPGITQYLVEDRQRCFSGSWKAFTDTEFIPLNNTNHLFHAIVSVEVCACQLLKLWIAQVATAEWRGKNQQSKKATYPYSANPPIQAGWFFHLAFVFCLIKMEMGAFSLPFSDIFGIRNFEERGDDRA